MAIFRLQENMPDVYPRKSRDFQLMCNTFDAMLNAVKFDIDSITYSADTQLCSDRLLPLLQTKLGFFSDKSFTTRELRTVLQVFKYVVRNKGSRIGIQTAIAVFLKLANASNKSRITIVDNHIDKFGYTSDVIPGNTYIVEVAIEGSQVDTTLLTELLKYVLPAGYRLRYSFYTALEQISVVKSTDTINIVFVNIGDSRGIRATTPDGSENRYPYEITWSSLEINDAGESYYFEQVDSDYKHIDSIPTNWPNGEYYKRLRFVKAINCTPKQIERPEYIPGKYYKDGVVLETETAPEDWGRLDDVFSYDKEGLEKISFTTNYVLSTEHLPYYTSATDNTETPFKDSNNKLYQKIDVDTSTGVIKQDDITDYEDIYYMDITDTYQRVYLPYNSINGVSTTAAHRALSVSGNHYEYSIEDDPKNIIRTVDFNAEDNTNE